MPNKKGLIINPLILQTALRVYENFTSPGGYFTISVK